jgi:Ca2+-binding EF-hand superfamily protein
MVRAKIEQPTMGGLYLLQQALELFDRDDSGDVNPNDFYSAMELMGLQFTEQQVSLTLFRLELPTACPG